MAVYEINFGFTVLWQFCTQQLCINETNSQINKEPRNKAGFFIYWRDERNIESWMSNVEDESHSNIIIPKE